MEHQQVRRTNQPERQTHASATTKPQLASNAGTHPLIQLQRTAGNQAVQRLMRSHLVEAKLYISQPHATSVPDDFVRGLGTGQPLDSASRAFFEPRFGYDFSRVRIHTDARADESSRRLNALAYTAGRDVVFGAGRYQPQTNEGKRLLAHELTHIVQQAFRPAPAVQRAPDTPKTKRAPGYVYLASGSHLTHHLIEAEKKKVRLLFARYRIVLDDSWLLEGEESGMPVLYLRWQSEWGSPPSLWMDPDVLEAFLQRRFAVESFEFATKPYEKEEYELTFSDEEKRWIQEVLELPEISLLFRSFKDLPAITLHRVREIESGAAGQTSGTEIAVSSKAYKKESRYPGETGKMEPATSEEEFKGTLIHELLHFVKGQTGDVESALVPPSVLMMAMVYPEKTALKLPRYAFGWFEHPKSGLFLHFDTPEVYTLPANPNLTILGTELDEIRKEKKYEPSPMPRSGDTISPEEDLAATMSLYLTSSRSRKLLETKYPLRYGLIEWYFKTHLPKVDKERLAGTK